MSLLDHRSIVDAPTVDEEFPRVVVVEGGSADDAIEELLGSVARGDREALDALKDRMGGLVRLNIHRVLGDAGRVAAVTDDFFAEVARDAIHFDPDRHCAQAWLLTRAHHRALDLVGELTDDDRQRALQAANATGDQG